MSKYIEDRVYMDPNSGCWIWTMSHNSEGYGQSKPIHGSRKAHRASWIMHHGPISDGMRILHKCDNKCCVNPAHLELGTAKQNMQDASKRGLTKNKLSEEQVADIRRDPRSHRIVATEYGVSHVLVGRIKRGERRTIP